MKTRTLAILTLSAALAACGSAPQRNAALDQARGRYASAQADPQVNALAPNELKRAGETLHEAEMALSDGRPTSTVDHLAYMTAQRVVVAQQTAASRASQDITAGAAAERDKMRLGMRTAEADTAQRQLAQSQQDVQRSDARISSLESELRELNAKETPRGMVVTLGDVLFRTGQSQLQPASATNLAKLADFFKRNPDRTALIEGHTDSVGHASANLALSGRRAQAVMTSLIELGVPADRLRTQAFGEEQPAASNDDATGRQMNRRVEIVFERRDAALRSPD